MSDANRITLYRAIIESCGARSSANYIYWQATLVNSADAAPYDAEIHENHGTGMLVSVPPSGGDIIPTSHPIMWTCRRLRSEYAQIIIHDCIFHAQHPNDIRRLSLIFNDGFRRHYAGPHRVHVLLNIDVSELEKNNSIDMSERETPHRSGTPAAEELRTQLAFSSECPRTGFFYLLNLGFLWWDFRTIRDIALKARLYELPHGVITSRTDHWTNANDIEGHTWIRKKMVLAMADLEFYRDPMLSLQQGQRELMHGRGFAGLNRTIRTGRRADSRR